MATLKVQQEIENDLFRVILTIDKTDLSESDRKLIQKFGEPKINVGGAYGSGGDSFTLPDEFVRIVTDFCPYVKEFDSTTAPFNSNTTVRVESFRTGVTTKWTGAITTLRTNVDTFTKQVLVQI